MTIEAATTMTATTDPIKLSFGPPVAEEYNELGRIVQESFEVSGSAVWKNCSRSDVLTFRIAGIHHKDSLRQLYDDGRISTCRRMMCARNAKTGKVIGVAIWALEDTWTPEAIKQREEETKLAFPMNDLPEHTNIELWDRVWKTFEKMQEHHLKDRPRCHLEYLCIDAKVQRSGAGTALLNIVRQDAGDRLIWLEAAATPSAYSFYKKIHFEDLGHFSVGDLKYTAMKLEPPTAS